MMVKNQEDNRRNGPVKVIGAVFNYSWIIKNIPFFLFTAVLAVLYIANGHMADNRVRKISDAGKKLKDLQYEYKTLKGEMMFKSRETEMIKAAAPLGLRTDSIAPYRIKLIAQEVKDNN